MYRPSIYLISVALIPLFWLSIPTWMYGQLEVFELEHQEDINFLIEDYFIGRGVKVSNITFQGTLSQFAQFTNSNSKLSIPNGLVMATGHAKISKSIDPHGSGNFFNQSPNSTSPNTSGGDLELAQIIGAPTFDAAVIEFDFVPEFDVIQFNYVFASEEYPEYNCSQFNDVFSFLLSGPDIPIPRNIAKIPGKDMVVAINTVNDGTIDPTKGAEQFCTPPIGSPANTFLYLDNAKGPHLEFDGLTRMLTATAAVIPCETYHIKLAIADVADNYLDSAVFFESLSFESVPSIYVTVKGPTHTQTAVEGCSELQLIFQNRLPGQVATSFPFQISGTALPGIDFEPLPNEITFAPHQKQVILPLIPIVDHLPEPIETITLTYTLPSCTFKEDSIQLYIKDQGILSVHPPDFSFCQGQTQTVQLQAKAGFLKDGNYRWSPTTGLSDPNIPNPMLTINQPQSYTVYYENGSCTDSLLWSAMPATPVIIDTLIHGLACDGQPVLLQASLSGDTTDIQYQWHPNESYNCPTCAKPALLDAHTSVNLQVRNKANCVDSAKIDLLRKPVLPQVALQCMDANEESMAIQWEHIPEATHYEVIINTTKTTLAFPESTFRINKAIYGQRPTFPFSIQAIDESDVFCPSEVSTIVCPTRNCVNPNDCAVFVPNAFSPNGDGMNDLLFIQAGPGIASIKSWQIFDRQGNLLFERHHFAPNDPQFAWNGKANNQPLNTGTLVWMTEVSFVDGTHAIFSGDVTLIR